MKIKSVIFKNHFLFKNTRINFFSDSVPIDKEAKKPFEIIFDEENAKKNSYSYFIGENGTGKSALLKSLAGIFNFNNSYIDKSIDHLEDFFGKKRYSFNKNTFSESQFLLDMGMDIWDSSVRNNNINDTQVIYVSNTLEKIQISRNPSFRHFNYFSDINRTKYLTMKALIRSDQKKQFDILNQLLNGGRTINWNIKSAIIAVKYDDDNGDAPFVAVHDDRIYDLLTLFEKMAGQEDNSLDYSLLTKSEKLLLADIERDGFFFKLYFDSKQSPRIFFKQLSQSYIYSKIWEFFGEQNIRTRKGILRGNGPRNASSDIWLFDLEDMRAQDILFAGLLENLGLIKLDLLLNDKPIEWLSSGEQSLIRLCSFFSDIPNPDDRKNLVMIIDEPENSLHPKWQHNFPVHFNAIADAYGVTSSHFIIATHSPLIIMKAAKPEFADNVAIIRLYRNGDEIGAKVIEDVNAYSIEEVMLDEFNISYRSKIREIEIFDELQSGLSNKRNDPIHSVENLEDFHNRIFDLLNRYKL